VLVHYGHSERAVMAGSMPDDHRYFVWPLYGHVELIDEAGRPITEPGVQGEVVATAFDNKVMPFIRYRTGDLAMWSAGPAHPALPGYPVLERIDGRNNDYFVGHDGRRIPVASLGCVPEFLQVEASQYEQFEPGQLIVRLQSAVPLSPRCWRCSTLLPPSCSAAWSRAARGAADRAHRPRQAPADDPAHQGRGGRACRVTPPRRW
jgi:phenylacetate-CoA ligase